LFFKKRNKKETQWRFEQIEKSLNDINDHVFDIYNHLIELRKERKDYDSKR